MSGGERFPRFCLAILFVAVSACAATIPSAATFEPSAWQAVEALQPGTAVEIVYVTGAPRPLRHTFRGRIESVDAAHLVIGTGDDVQRLEASRVLRVAVGVRRSYTTPLALTGAVAGVLLSSLWSALGERSDDDARRQAVIGGVIGGALGASIGRRLGGERPVVVYSRGSL